MKIGSFDIHNIKTTMFGYFLFTMSLLLNLNLAYSQQSKVTITAVETVDYQVNYKKERCLKTESCVHRMVYFTDSLNPNKVISEYTVTDYYSYYNGDSVVFRKKTLTPRKCFKKISRSGFISLTQNLNNKPDTSGNHFYFAHTSHHYQNIYVEIIQNGDTATYHKSKPFGENIAWHVQTNNTFVLNPEIDWQLATMLPKRFLLREKLTPVKNTINH